MTRGVPASAGEGDSRERRTQKWVQALDRMREALGILDASQAPAEVGADLDMAINRLAEAIDSESADRT